jgi:hypothetical protein
MGGLHEETRELPDRGKIVGVELLDLDQDRIDDVVRGNICSAVSV